MRIERSDGTVSGTPFSNPLPEHYGRLIVNNWLPRSAVREACREHRDWASNGSGVLLMGSLCPMTYASGHETTDAETNTARAAGRPAGEEASGSFAQGAPGSQVEGQRAAYAPVGHGDE